MWLHMQSVSSAMRLSPTPPVPDLQLLLVQDVLRADLTVHSERWASCVKDCTSQDHAQRQEGMPARHFVPVQASSDSPSHSPCNSPCHSPATALATASAIAPATAPATAHFLAHLLHSSLVGFKLSIPDR